MLKELLGSAYKDGMTFDEIEKELSGKKLCDLNSGEYVAKGKLTEKDNKLKDIESKYNDLSKEFNDYKATKMTDEEKAAEKAKHDQEALDNIMKENRKYKLKDQLYDSGYSKDEVKELLDNDMSPETFAKIAQARVDEAVKKSTARGIKDTTHKPAADKNDTDDGEITQEDFDKMGYNERLNLYNNDRETYDKFN